MAASDHLSEQQFPRRMGRKDVVRALAETDYPERQPGSGGSGSIVARPVHGGTHVRVYNWSGPEAVDALHEHLSKQPGMEVGRFHDGIGVHVTFPGNRMRGDR